MVESASLLTYCSVLTGILLTLYYCSNSLSLVADQMNKRPDKEVSVFFLGDGRVRHCSSTKSEYSYVKMFLGIVVSYIVYQPLYRNIQNKKCSDVPIRYVYNQVFQRAVLLRDNNRNNSLNVFLISTLL